MHNFSAYPFRAMEKRGFIMYSNNILNWQVRYLNGVDVEAIKFHPIQKQDKDKLIDIDICDTDTLI